MQAGDWIRIALPGYRRGDTVQTIQVVTWGDVLEFHINVLKLDPFIAHRNVIICRAFGDVPVHHGKGIYGSVTQRSILPCQRRGKNRENATLLT